MINPPSEVEEYLAVQAQYGPKKMVAQLETYRDEI
jgi:hypothetical protein